MIYRKGVIKMQVEKADWQWFLSFIATVAAPFIGEWLHEKGLFHRRNRDK